MAKEDKTPGVFLKPLVRQEMTAYVDGYGNHRDWRKYNKNLNVQKFTIQPNPFQRSLTFRALVTSEEPRDPNNSIGAVRNVRRADKSIRKVRKRPAPKRFIQYLVTVRFHGLDFRDTESAQFNQKWEVAGRTFYTRTPTIAANPAMLKCQCFTGDTLIRLANGESIPIKDLVGQEVDVASWDENKKRFFSSRATNIRSYGHSKLVKVTLNNGEQIRCTPDHKFLLKTGEWVEASKLNTSDSLEPLYGEGNTFKHNGSTRVLRKKIETEDFYVYVYLDPRQEGQFTYGDMEFSYKPFYVGKGRKGRDKQHLTLSGNTGFYRYLKEMKDSGVKPIILRVKDTVSEDRAHLIERELIDQIGMLKNGGLLTNERLGGDGQSGFTSERVIERMRYNNPMKLDKTVLKVQYARKELGINNGTNFRSKDPDVRKKISETRSKRIASGEIDMSKTHEKLAQNNRDRAKNGLIYTQSDEGKLKLSIRNKELMKNGRGLALTKNFQKQRELINWLSDLPVGSITLNKDHLKETGYTQLGHLTRAIKKCCSKVVGVEIEGKELKKHDTYNHKVVSVEDDGYEEVFCMTVSQFGNFVVSTSDKSGVVVKNCRDFMFTFEKPLADYGALWPNNVWTKYQRLTPKGTGYPERNPNEKMGYCKHIATLLQYLADSGLLRNR